MVRTFTGRSAVIFCRVFRKEIAVLRQHRWPLDLVDVAFNDLNADSRPFGLEFLHGDDSAREHVAIGAVLLGNPPRHIVERRERDLLADEFSIERRQLLGAVNGRTLDRHRAHDDGDFLRSRRSRGAWQRNRQAAGLRARSLRHLETLALPPGLRARRYDLRNGADWTHQQRQRRENAANAGEHAPTPLMYGESMV